MAVEIEQAKDYIRCLGNVWNLSSDWTEDVCRTISENMESRPVQSEMEMRI